MASFSGSGSFGDDMSSLFSDSSGAQSPQASAAAESVRSRSPAPSARSEITAGRSFVSDVEGPGLHPEFETYLDQVYGRTDKMIEPRHETLMSVFKKHEDTLEKYLRSGDIGVLKTFILQNFGKIVWLDYLQARLKELVEAFATADQKRLVLKYDYNAESMIRVLRALLEDYQRKFAVLDLSAEFPDTAEGLEVIVEKTRRKMSQIIEELQSTIRNQQDEMAIMKDNLLQMAELRAELEAERNHVRYLYERDKYAVADPSSQEQFMQDLQYRLNMQEQLGSSLREELEQERRSKEEILEQYLQVETKRIQEHQEKMREIAEATRHLEMKEVIQQAIIEKIQTLTPNTAEVRKSVDEWIKTTQQVLEENKNDVYSLTMKFREVHKTVTNLKLDIEERQKEIPIATAELENTNIILTEIKALIEERRNEIADAKYKLDRMVRDLRDLTLAYRVKEEEFVTREEDVEKISEEVEKLKAYYKSLREQMASVPDHLSKLARDQSKGRLEPIPEQESIELQMTPEEHQMTPEEHQMTLEEHQMTPKKRKMTPKERKMTPKVRKMTPKQYERLTPRMKQRLAPEVREMLRGAPFSPEQITEKHVEQPLVSPFAASISSRIPPLSPSPPRASQEPQIPAITITPPPASRSSEASVSPFVTTPHYESPFISKSPFEYTDPAAEEVKELNLPLSPYEITPFRQTVVLPSPKKEEPLVVNIAVDPKPIIETTSGECFVCDISLDVQPGGHSTLPQLQQIGEDISPHRLDMSSDIFSEMSETPIIKGRTWRHNVPPEVTPTSTRRYGLFTPRGIFKKGQYNIRRIPGSHPIPEPPWSPTYLPEDAKSPASPSSPPPIVWSDKSMSWEGSSEGHPGLFPTSKTTEMSDSPIIRRRVWRYNVPPEITPTSTRRYGLFTPRGIFKKGHYNIRRIPGSHPIPEPPWSPTYLPDDAKSPASPFSPPPIVWSDRSLSWERSPERYFGSSPEYLHSPLTTETTTSPSPIIKGPTHRYFSDESDTSPSPVIKGPTRTYLSSEYDTSPSPIIKGPTDRYFSDESDTSPSPVIKGPTRAHLSSEYETSPSPVIKGPTRTHLSSEYDTSPSPVIKGPTHRYQSSDSDSSSASPALRRGLYGDPYPVIPSPLFDTPPSGYESELDRSRTPQSIRTYDDSSLNRTYQSPNRSVSPQHSSYQESFLNRRVRFDDEAELDVALNRRWQPDEIFHSYGISDNSPTSSRYQTFDNSFSSPQSSYQGDPLNRRLQLSEMFESIPDQSFSPQTARTADGYFSPDGTYSPDSTEFERS